MSLKQGGTEDILISSLANDDATPPSALEESCAYIVRRTLQEALTRLLSSAEIQETVTSRRYAFGGIRDTRCDSRRAGMVISHRVLRVAHVESVGFYWREHSHGADHLGRDLDELCGPKHWSDAV